MFPPTTRRCRRVAAAALLASLILATLSSALDPVPVGKPIRYPDWWFQRGIIRRVDMTVANPEHPQDYPAADDFAALNVGQLKTVAVAAAAELDNRLPGGAGTSIHDLISVWAGTQDPDNFAAVNLGQLKSVAKRYYDRLIAVGYATGYPWEGAGRPADNFAVANLGQLKTIFSFDLTYDGDHDGVPDWLEYSGMNELAGLPLDGDGDGLTDAEEALDGTNPLSPDHPSVKLQAELILQP